MDIIKIHYSGRVTAGIQKKFALNIPKRTKSDKELYMEQVLSVHHYTEAKRLVDTMGLASVPILQKSPQTPHRTRRGLKGISSQGRQLVKDAVLYLEETYGRERLSFLTLTIPPECLKPELFPVWSDLAKKLRQRLSYALEAHGLSPNVVGVVELQEERQRTVGEIPCLHWHLVFVGKHPRGAWAFRPQFFQEMWGDLLQKATGIQPVTDQHAHVDSIHTSAYGYLGKYMSKGFQACSQVNPDWLPSAWYMCTRKLQRIVKQRTVHISGPLARWFWELLNEYKGYFKFSKFVEIDTGLGYKFCAGWYGDLISRDARKELLWILREEQLKDWKSIVKSLNLRDLVC